jgi:hypothetical protein
MLQISFFGSLLCYDWISYCISGGRYGCSYATRQDSVTVDVGLYSLMERFNYEVSDVTMMNLVKEVSIDPILPSSYALLDSYLNSLLVNLKNHETLGSLSIKDIQRPVNVEVSLNPTQKNFLKYQIKFTDKFYEMAGSVLDLRILNFLNINRIKL